MSLLAIFNKLQTSKEPSFKTYLSNNNVPINNYCNFIPIVKPSLISTTFGQSLVTLIILLVYSVLVKASGNGYAVESRIIKSLVLGNVIFTVLSFNDWFNLNHSIVFCNDYKNGVLNLYQISELIEHYKLTNFIKFHLEFLFNALSVYGTLAYKQFVQFFIDGTKEAIQIIQNFRR